MEAQQILQPGFLDILFDGKNKLYGAYDLRKTYNQRITKALVATLVLMSVLAISVIFSRKFVKEKSFALVITDPVVLKNFAPDKPKTIPKLPAPVHVATLQVTPPVIAKNIVTPPPDIHQIEAAVIDVKTIMGPQPGIGIINPPTIIVGTNVIAKPTNKSSDETTFVPIEKEATFSGGAQAWQKYIQKAIQRQLDEFTDHDYGTCVVKFQVDAQGKCKQCTSYNHAGNQTCRNRCKHNQEGAEMDSCNAKRAFCNSRKIATGHFTES